ncbi:alkaline phosphatase PhoX [Wenzhouxiangella marina]|uniref:Phosphatase n=1 Tax=Wenzhouxiangella marina TaxID=1579979 RepID=A0A0K0XUP4_9GAMM|nr:alkaline phosphatase PhoX [Wenzhouxiangella marina]AKS41403.1 phosphatase [Wenzhouxiangella marina]MBB6086843.1 hypothetical protein [Wenzhouxiangella marina]
MISRRRFIGSSAAAVGAAFIGYQRQVLGRAHAILPGWRDFGPVRPDPAGVFDLPAGFAYTVIARLGETMHDGLRRPGLPDGMAAFPGADGQVILICNHEVEHDESALGPFGPNGELADRIDASRVYDPGRRLACSGGTTTLVYDPSARRVTRSWMSLAGTENNCAGGPTPWGSWLSCEETVVRSDQQTYTRDHGWVFEVPASATEAVEPVPLTAMGRFNHEACAVDPATGIVYLTEDRSDGLFYRFIPNRPGELAAGGRLQALALKDRRRSDTRNWPENGASSIAVNEALAVEWIDLDRIDAPDDDLRHRGAARGAAVFARGEGLWWGDGEAYFACTNGGPDRYGQIFRYRPSDEQLSLFVQSSDHRLMKSCDNLTVSPWGDLLVCEDRDDHAGLVGVTPAGELYEFGRNAYSTSELCGVCFAPDGQTLFVNIQKDGLTLAIHGPFPTAGT